MLNILVTIDSGKAIKTGDISEGKWWYKDLEIMVFENTASVLWHVSNFFLHFTIQNQMCKCFRKIYYW